MIYGANPGQGLNPALRFANFFKHQITKNYTYFKIMEDLEDPSAKIGIF
jgi:hypothetical protein